MTGALSNEQEDQVRAIVAEMIGQALEGAGERISRAISGSVVLLPLVHSHFDAAAVPIPSHGNVGSISTGKATV